jgi:hypothetical protein
MDNEPHLFRRWMTPQAMSAALNRTKHFDPRMSFVVNWVPTNVCRCSAWKSPARLSKKIA